MAKLTLSNEITPSDLLPFDLFTVTDRTVATALVPIKNLEASTSMINLLLRNIGWKGHSFKDVDQVTKIGYNLVDGVDSVGLTEVMDQTI